MDKILCLGDIHGRPIWYDIIQKENPDKIIFLGDYLTSHYNIKEEQQLSNLEDILNYKEEYSDKVILLRGNHDCEMLGYHWARCYPDFLKKDKIDKKRFLNNTQWIYIDGTNLFSHAGVSDVWLHNQKITLANINNEEPSEKFGFIPDNYRDNCGNSNTQPCTWIRPDNIVQCNIKGYDQYVGHTPVPNIYSRKSEINDNQIWFLDSLEYGNYITIENNNVLKHHVDYNS